jgi:hypothetical protein
MQHQGESTTPAAGMSRLWLLTRERAQAAQSQSKAGRHD